MMVKAALSISSPPLETAIASNRCLSSQVRTVHVSQRTLEALNFL
ncbi:MAG: hypothetical protein ACM37W_12175 [Actinomycetota bacterium]